MVAAAAVAAMAVAAAMVAEAATVAAVMVVEVLRADGWMAPQFVRREWSHLDCPGSRAIDKR